MAEELKNVEEQGVAPVEEARDEYLENEDDLLRGLLEAAEGLKQNVATIEIVRNKKVLFRFDIRGLSEQEYEECRVKATKYTYNRRFGNMPTAVEVNVSLFRSLLIFKATVERDRQRLWMNKQAWERLGVLSGPELIDRVLSAGEKEAVVDKIDKLSGYVEEMEEVAKNS